MAALTCIDLWNGVKKQNTEELNQGLRILDWERTTHPEKHKANLDEVAAQALLRSSILRNMKQYTEAKDLLKTEILSHDRYISSLSQVILLYCR